MKPLHPNANECRSGSTGVGQDGDKSGPGHCWLGEADARSRQATVLCRSPAQTSVGPTPKKRRRAWPTQRGDRGKVIPADRAPRRACPWAVVAVSPLRGGCRLLRLICAALPCRALRLLPLDGLAIVVLMRAAAVRHVSHLLSRLLRLSARRWEWAGVTSGHGRAGCTYRSRGYDMFVEWRRSTREYPLDLPERCVSR